MTATGPLLGTSGSAKEEEEEALSEPLKKSTIPLTESSSSIASTEELPSHSGVGVLQGSKQVSPSSAEKVNRRGIVKSLRRMSSWHVKKNEEEASSQKTHKRCSSASATMLSNHASCSIISATPALKSCMKVRKLEESLVIKEEEPSHHHKRSVSFDKVFIREHVRTVGDNPCASSGPPLALGWAFAPQEEMPLEDFESSRRPRRAEQDLKLPGMVRRQMLKGTWGIPESVLTKFEEDAYVVQHNRRLSYSFRCFDRTEEVMETAWRRTKRLVKGTSKKREQEWLCENARQYAMAKDAALSKTGEESTLVEEPRYSEEYVCPSAQPSIVHYDDSQLDFGEDE